MSILILEEISHTVLGYRGCIKVTDNTNVSLGLTVTLISPCSDVSATLFFFFFVFNRIYDITQIHTMFLLELYMREQSSVQSID